MPRNTDIDDIKDQADDMISVSKREYERLKKQGSSALKSVAHQANDSLGIIEDEALALKKAVVGYANAKPVEAALFGLARSI